LDESNNPNGVAQLSGDDIDSTLDKEYKVVDSMLGKPISDSSVQSSYEEKGESKGVSSNTEVDKSSIRESETDAVETTTNLDGTDPSIARFADLIPESGKCIIILGSFRRTTNVTKMVSQVERLGHKAYVGEFNGLTRVGFDFECSGVDLEEYLNNIRRTVSTEAWYLEPGVDIPFR